MNADDSPERTLAAVDHAPCPSDGKCPECAAVVLELWSGVKCSACSWWHCS
jgi:hypothetical protein